MANKYTKCFQNLSKYLKIKMRDYFLYSSNWKQIKCIISILNKGTIGKVYPYIIGGNMNWFSHFGGNMAIF